MVKRGFTLIELIFAIIVVSIAMLALPALFSAASRSTEEVLKDEATFQGFRTAGVILTYAWDEASINPETNTSFILDTSAGDAELGRSALDPLYRIGNFYLGKKRRFFDNPTFASTTLGMEANETTPDDIDDFNGSVEPITSALMDVNVSTTVRYNSDSAAYSFQTLGFTFGTAAPAGTTSIKQISVSVVDKDGNTILTYSAFATNTGTTPIKTRIYK